MDFKNILSGSVLRKNGTKIETNAFLDTGNKLIDPYKRRPIILLNKELIKIDYTKDNILLVPYDSLNNHGLLKCIIPEKIYIKGIGFKKDLLVGLSNEKIKIDGIDCILNQQLLKERIL